VVAGRWTRRQGFNDINDKEALKVVNADVVLILSMKVDWPLVYLLSARPYARLCGIASSAESQMA
jgi:hypothetical protein